MCSSDLMALMNALDVKLGFGFSAGLFDYVLNYGLATRPLLLLPVGAAYFAIYYFAFRFCIVRFDLKTPGREVEVADQPAIAGATGDQATGLVRALGGAANLQSIDACTTRLRLRLVDPAKVDEAALKTLGARGVVRPGGNALQVVLGPIADRVAGEMRSLGKDVPEIAEGDDALWIAALGGRGNVLDIAVGAGRVRARVADVSAIDRAAMDRSARRGWQEVAPGVVHALA